MYYDLKNIMRIYPVQIQLRDSTSRRDEVKVAPEFIRG